MTDFWTAEKIEILREMAPHRSATKIGERLGCTRNAIIGKAHRLHITLGGPPPQDFTPYKPPTPVPKKAKPAPKLKRIVATIPMPAAPAPHQIVSAEPILGPVTIADLTDRRCRWPIGDPASDEFRYCGAAKAILTPYCDGHRKIGHGHGTKRECTAIVSASHKLRASGEWA